MEKFHISWELKQRLSEINSPISTALIELEEIEVGDSDYVNYLGVSKDNPEMVSFMNKSKIERFKDATYGEEVIDEDYRHCCQLIISDWGAVSKLLKIPEGGLLNKITIGGVPPQMFVSCVNLIVGYHYTTASGTRKYETILGGQIIQPYVVGAEPVTKTKEFPMVWNPDVRIKARASKTVRRIFGGKFNDKEYEEFSRLYRVQAIKDGGCISEYIFKELSGDLS